MANEDLLATQVENMEMSNLANELETKTLAHKPK